MNKRKILLFLLVAFVATLMGGYLYNLKKDTEPEQLNLEDMAIKRNLNIINEYPHDATAFTQGLVVHQGKLYEGTGLEKETRLRIVDITTGKASYDRRIKDSVIFGEGITILNNKLYQLTWKNNKVFQYDLPNLDAPKNVFNFPNEGWGITNDGTNLWVSDGNEFLYKINPTDFSIIEKIAIKMNGSSLKNINELEYINGYIYANVWGQDYIVKIDLNQKKVVEYFDMSLLRTKFQRSEDDDVLNGIAYDSVTKKIYLTGKRWPKVFECSLP